MIKINIKHRLLLTFFFPSNSFFLHLINFYNSILSEINQFMFSVIRLKEKKTLISIKNFSSNNYLNMYCWALFFLVNFSKTKIIINITLLFDNKTFK